MPPLLRSGTPRRGKRAGNSVACGGAEWDAGGTAWKARGKGLVLFLSIYSGTACRPLQSGNWLLPMHPVRAGISPRPRCRRGKGGNAGAGFLLHAERSADGSVENAMRQNAGAWRCVRCAFLHPIVRHVKMSHRICPCFPICPIRGRHGLSVRYALKVIWEDCTPSSMCKSAKLQTYMPFIYCVRKKASSPKDTYFDWII